MRTLRFLAPALVGLAIAGCAGAPSLAPQQEQPQTAQPQAAPQGQTPPGTGAPQGIAVGEPAPGGRVMDSIQPASPCIEEFSTLDANGDGHVELDEWTAVRGDESAAAFKAEDTNADGRLDSLEFCQ